MSRLPSLGVEVKSMKPLRISRWRWKDLTQILLAFSRVENPSPDQSQSALRKIPENDGDSLDDYSEGQQFGEDGSFIEEYVD